MMVTDPTSRLPVVAAAVAAAACGLAAVFILAAVARGLADTLGWPIWAGFGVVGAALAVLGGVALAIALRTLRSPSPPGGGTRI